MKTALILAAGRGTRLDRPNTPKPLVDVGGTPIISRLINQFSQIGIKTVHVVVGYESQRVRRTLASHPWDNISLRFHDNPDWEKNMASSILAAKGEIDGPFLLVMGDHVFDDVLIRKLAQTTPAQHGVTSLVDARSYEKPIIDSALKVQTQRNLIVDVGWQLSSYNAIDAGLFAASQAVFEASERALSLNPTAQLSDGLRILAKEGRLSCLHATQGAWDDVDTPADVVRTEARLRRALRSQKITPLIAPIPPSVNTTEFDYVVGKPETVKMVVQRGAVRQPELTDLIPEQGASSPIFVFTDETVGQLYATNFCQALSSSGYDLHLITLPDGEEAKTLSNYLYLVERVLSRGVDERSVFLSLGGGVVCNVCGFVASTIYRGLDLVQVPTTLMAQCDAAISHKQAINGQRGKNMVGSYYPPRKVVVDVETLETLTNRQIRDGLAEVIKHALGQDAALARQLFDYNGNIRNLDFLESVIKKNIELKCQIVCDDPKEHKLGMVLQYGHTVGHPIEHLSGYTLHHGESIAIGMMVAVRVARILGACSDELVHTHEALIKKFGLPIKVPPTIKTRDMLDALRFNKRYLIEGTRMALLCDLGKLWQVDNDYVIPVSDRVVAEAIRQTREDSP